MTKKLEGVESQLPHLPSSRSREGRFPGRYMKSLAGLPWLLLFRLGRRRQLLGLEVCVAAGTLEAEIVFDRVEDALRLIATYDTRLFGEIRQDVPRLLFTETPGGHYLSNIRACRIGIAYATRVPTINLAMMIIHEATHAHLASESKGLSEDHEFVERACVDAEIAFAEKVPGSEDAIRNVRELLETQWWNMQRHAEATARELVERGVPRWLAGWIVRRNLNQ